MEILTWITLIALALCAAGVLVFGVLDLLCNGSFATPIPFLLLFLMEAALAWPIAVKLGIL